MQEQMRRAVQRARREQEEEGTIDVQQTEGSAEVVEDAECCLTDIDAALEDAACCLAEAQKVLVKTWREMDDQELIDHGEPEWGEGEYAPGEKAYDEFVDHQVRYDQVYENITGVQKHAYCCGRRCCQ